MIPDYPPSSTQGDFRQSQSTPDPLDEFLSQFLDIPILLPTPTQAPTQTPTHVSAPVPAPAPISEPPPNLTCHWISQDDPSRVCGAPLSSDPKLACLHFRVVHRVRGNDKATTSCCWHACRAAPMKRGSVTRHVLTVHLRMLRWRCETCGRVFSRRGTTHTCSDEAVA